MHDSGSNRLVLALGRFILTAQMTKSLYNELVDVVLHSVVATSAANHDDDDDDARMVGTQLRD